ncbi:MAG: TlpA disulfide reductase family protein [Rhodobacteraceae bacterium]|nr:TlpA disulfide reductase family protein [Paracoccaceae bacterium]
MGIRSGALLLYGLLSAFAIAVSASAASPEHIRLLREHTMQKLVVHDQPRETTDVPFFDANGAEVRLDEFLGSVVVMNFWATWCAPCLKEMPSLDRMSAQLSDMGVEVIAIAAGPNPRPGVDRFLADAQIQHLEVYFDPKLALMRSLGVFGIPITFILDRNGKEIARLTGDAEWDSSSAIAIIEYIASQS